LVYAFAFFTDYPVVVFVFSIGSRGGEILSSECS